MQYLLDTDIASYIIKERVSTHALRKLSTLDPAQVSVSAITRAELLFGLKQLPEKHRLHIAVRKFLNSVQVLSWPPEAADLYAEIRHQLTRSGDLIGEMDMLIAAQALAMDAVLVTNNIRHFKRIKLPLMMENWME